MESIIHKIRFMRDEMGPAEKLICDYILNNANEITGISISELAKRCGCGDATVVRFSRKLGFDGYQSLKIGIATEIKLSSSVEEEITKKDTCFEIFQKRINDVSVALKNTESVLDEERLEEAAKKIMSAKRIVIFGLGNSAAIAQDAAHKFLRLGLNAQACCDNHLQAIIASHLDRQSVTIAISHSGSSKDIVEAVQLSKIGGATTIGITNYGSSPLNDNCDIVLHTKSDETRRSILAMSSRIAQLAIFDAIYTYIVVNTDKESVNAVYNTEVALQNKKY
ncbi:MAG: MurR/RpiR family transcriptional regulator [Ruminococcaceae bacterium]|nr:MurR/RpiR family transcriptional regulator [Oscillospiraceae bacterium]